MAVLPEVSALLTASTYFTNVDSTTSVPVWLSEAPDTSNDTALIVIESPGSPPLYTQAGVEVTRPRIQVLGRATTYTKAREVADTAWNILSAVTETDLSGVRYHTITPLQQPYDMGNDGLGRSLIGSNYAIERVST